MIEAWNGAVSRLNPHWRYYTKWLSFFIVIFLEIFNMQRATEPCDGKEFCTVSASSTITSRVSAKNGWYSKLQQIFPLLNILCDPVVDDTKGFLSAARVVLDRVMKDVNCLDWQSSFCHIKNRPACKLRCRASSDARQPSQKMICL
jgi:hypothetical protein